MKKNVGGLDRTIRLAVGASALAAVILLPLRFTRRMALLGIGAMDLFSGITRYCPLNETFGFNTYREPKDTSSNPRPQPSTTEPSPTPPKRDAAERGRPRPL